MIMQKIYYSKYHNLWPKKSKGVNPLGAQAANLASYKSIPKCWARQIGWLINAKIDFEPKPLHRYNFPVIAAIYKQ